jgi:D-aminopeptidase
MFVAFATGNRGLSLNAGEAPDSGGPVPLTTAARLVVDGAINPLLLATVEAVEEAVVNCLLAAETMTGRDGITAHALPHGRLLEILAHHGRNPETAPGV